LSGLGGVGKTSIAFTFAERLISQPPSYIDRLVWLGAKEETFSPLGDEFLPTSRFDFDEIDEFLVQLLLQLGCPINQVPDEPSRQQLMYLVQQHLGAFSYFLIVDNADTFSDDDQRMIIGLLTQLCSITKSKAIITARSNISGISPAAIEVEGLDLTTSRSSSQINLQC
jgi:hypothetical protein